MSTPLTREQACDKFIKQKMRDGAGGYRWETMIDEDTGKLCCASCCEEVEAEQPAEARAAK